MSTDAVQTEASAMCKTLLLDFTHLQQADCCKMERIDNAPEYFHE